MEQGPDEIPVLKNEAESPVQVKMAGNHLLVNGRSLEVTDSVDLLSSALKDSQAILEGLEEFRQKMQRLHPDAEVGLAPFTVMNFPQHPKRVLSKTGQELKKHYEQVFTDINDLREEFHPYWRAVEGAGYTPDLRVYWSGAYWVGLWARVPTLEDIGNT